MRLYRMKIRRYLRLSAVLLLLIPVLAVQVLNSDWHPYTPTGSLPEHWLSKGLFIVESGFDPAFLDYDRPAQLSIFDYPFPVTLSRAAPASRSAPTMRAVDWRLLRDELAFCEIELKSDSEETINVELATEAINGIIIRPFEVFSFNAAVGPRSEGKGYRMGLMYANGEVVQGIGGGVCIVSTALYTAAAKAGLKIIERWHHSGPVRYADVGMDAAIVYGCLDLQLKNDTQSPILIKSTIKEGRLVVRLLGKKQPGLDVQIHRTAYKELPYKVVESVDPELPAGEVRVKTPARNGFEVTITRVFTLNGKVIKRETLCNDIVLPRNKLVLVSSERIEQTLPSDARSVDIPLQESVQLEVPPLDAWSHQSPTEAVDTVE